MPWYTSIFFHLLRWIVSLNLRNLPCSKVADPEPREEPLIAEIVDFVECLLEWPAAIWEV
jgi:hypothetical protein